MDGGWVISHQVLLEWDYSKGKPTVPLLKDKYGAERRKVGKEAGRQSGHGRLLALSARSLGWLAGWLA